MSITTTQKGENMKYQLRMIVDVDETEGSDSVALFKLEDWMCSLPEAKGGLIDFGIAETERDMLDKSGSWE